MPKASPLPPNTRRVLGLDPGTRLVGWAVLESRDRHVKALGHGTLRARPSLPTPERLAILAAGLREVLAAHGPREAAVETAFHGRSAPAALSLGEGRGAALLVVAEAGLEVTGYANNVVKRAVTGAGRATKERVQAMVMRVLSLQEVPETFDASDALALALCHLRRSGRQGLAASGPSPRILEAIRKARRGRRR